MNHLYQNGEGEIVAADSLEQAIRYHDCELGGMATPEDGWTQIPDDAKVPIGDPHGTGKTETKTAKEWASEYDEPTQAATTYL